MTNPWEKPLGDVKKVYATAHGPRYEQRVRRSQLATVRVSGIITQGATVGDCHDVVTLPAELIAAGETVYRVAEHLARLELAAGDLLIVAARSRPSRGELVIATVQDCAFIGRWWDRDGARSLVDNDLQVIVDARALSVLGSVTLIARG